MMTGIDSPLLYRPEFISPSEPTGLWWCQDAEDVQAVAINAVCKSTPADWADVGRCSEFVEQFPYIFVAIPSGARREEVVQELTTRFGIPVLVPAAGAFHGHLSVRELRDAGGPRALDKLLYGAEEVPIQGLLNLADVDCERKLSAERVLSGFRKLDAAIGGFSPGDLSVWTGKRGDGKSTLLGQMMLEAVNQGHRVCVYSGELPKHQFKLTLLQQAAGRDHVSKREDKRTGHVFFDVDPVSARKINEWWDKRLFLTDIQCRNAHDEDNVLKLFQYAKRRHGCDVFLVDNIMTASLKEAVALGYWQAQSAFTGRLVAFAKGNGVHVHLVAHPRKTDRRLEADDVGGSADITNRADNVLKVERVREERVEQAGYSMMLTVLKNREFGVMPKVELDFSPESRRFYPASSFDAREFSWERIDSQGGQIEFQELQGMDDGNPFAEEATP